MNRIHFALMLFLLCIALIALNQANHSVQKSLETSKLVEVNLAKHTEIKPDASSDRLIKDLNAATAQLAELRAAAIKAIEAPRGNCRGALNELAAHIPAQ